MTITEEHSKRPQPQTGDWLGGGAPPCAQKLSVEGIPKNVTIWTQPVGGFSMEEVSVQLTLPLRILQTFGAFNSAAHPGILWLNQRTHVSNTV